jgi:hypothetical protein
MHSKPAIWENPAVDIPSPSFVSPTMATCFLIIVGETRCQVKNCGEARRACPLVGSAVGIALRDHRTQSVSFESTGRCSTNPTSTDCSVQLQQFWGKVGWYMGYNNNSHISIVCWGRFDTKPAMLFPVLALVLRRTVLDQLAFAADLSPYRRPCGVNAAFPARGGGALATLSHGRVHGERDVAIDPVAHLACSHAPKRPAPPAPLQREHRRSVEAMSRKSDHLAVLCATRVGAAGWEVEKDIGRGDEERVCEEDL